MSLVEKSVALVARLITQGPLALLEMAREFIGELPGMFFGSLIEWVRNTIIVKAVQKLISMFNPVGAIIQAVIAIYHTVRFFIERAKQIAALVGAVFNSIVEIAGGNIGKANAAVENALAKGLPVAISFLAALVGIGGIAAKIKEIIRKIRKPIEKAVGKAVGLVVGKAKALIAKMTGGDKPKEKPPRNQAEHDAQVKAGLAAIDEEEKKYLEDKQISRENAEKVADTVKKANSIFKSISVVDGGETWDYEYIASPRKIKKGKTKLPHGFKSFGQLKQFGEAFQAGLTRAGFSGTQIFLQGSAVTGRSFETREPFDFGRFSDFDVALSNKELFDKSNNLGLTKGSRTQPIKMGSPEAVKLGINDTLIKVSKMANGREINIMVFENVDSLRDKESNSIRIPTKFR